MRKALFITCLLFSSLNSFGQNSAGLWTGATAHYSYNKDLRFSLEVQTRFDRNISRLDKAFLAPQVRYDFGKYLRLAGEYRISSVPYNSSTSNRTMAYRFGMDLEFRNLQKLISKESRFDLSVRARNTYEWENEKMTDSYLRGKLEIAYDIKNSKLRPSFSAEAFYHFNDRIIYTFSSVESVNRVNKMRYTLGLERPFAKRHEVKGYLILQPDLIDGSKEFILGLGYSYEFKRKKA